MNTDGAKPQLTPTACHQILFERVWPEFKVKGICVISKPPVNITLHRKAVVIMTLSHQVEKPTGCHTEMTHRK